VLVALTGWGQEQDQQRAYAAGFDHHVTKPAEPDVLDELIAAAAPRA
jgi:CheY-like chemotaxis protein